MGALGFKISWFTICTKILVFPRLFCHNSFFKALNVSCFVYIFSCLFTISAVCLLLSAVLFTFSAICLLLSAVLFTFSAICLHFQLFVYFFGQLFVYIFSYLFTFSAVYLLLVSWLFTIWIFAPKTLFFHDFFATTDASTKFEFSRQKPCFFMTFLPLQMLQHLNCKLLLKVLDIFGHFCNFSDFQIEFYQLLEFFKGFFHAFISGFPRFSSWGFSDFWTFLPFLPFLTDFPIEIISNNLCFPLHSFLDF